MKQAVKHDKSLSRIGFEVANTDKIYHMARIVRRLSKQVTRGNINNAKIVNAELCI